MQPGVEAEQFCPYLQKDPYVYPEDPLDVAGLHASRAIQLLKQSWLLSAALSMERVSRHLPVLGVVPIPTGHIGTLYLQKTLSKLWFSPANKHYFHSYLDKI